MTAITGVAYMLILATFVGWAAFRWMYRPWRMRGHSRTGRHLIRTADSMLLLLGVSLVQVIVPIPLTVMAVLTVLVLAFLAWVAWERVVILRRERRERAARELAADVEDTA